VTRFSRDVLATCRRRALLGGGDSVLVALSGGADSTALLSSLAELRGAGEVGPLFALHVDHGLRKGSQLDGEACARTCELLRVAFRVERVEVAPGNVQSRARVARYAALRREAIRVGATRIATGHTQDDQAETVLLRLLRGAGARGLAGIPPRRGAIIRPLLDRTRAEVEAFVASSGLRHVEDPSNATPRFLRNRVRSELVPVLRALAPQGVRSIARTADLLRDDERALAAGGGRLAADGSARVADLLAAPVAVRRRAVRHLWRTATGRRSGLEARHVEAVLALLARRSPVRVALPLDHEAVVRYGALSVRAVPDAGRATASSPVRIDRPGGHLVPGGRLEVGAAVGVAWPLWWRTRRPGDRFRPEGGRGSKKLKAWLIDRKVPREVRDGLRVLADDRGWVLWMPDLEARSESPGVEIRLIPG